MCCPFISIYFERQKAGNSLGRGTVRISELRVSAHSWLALVELALDTLQHELK